MRNLIFFLFLLWSLDLYAQKDTTLTMGECESLFLKNNLDLIASNFNISAAKAAIIQARTWDNPVVSLGFNGYNPERKQYFDIGSLGEKSAGIEQLIYLGGKKRNEVALAAKNAEIAELEFADLLRNLKLQLRQSYFGLYYQNLSFKSILKQISALDSLVTSYQNQSKRGNVSLKDVVRLQSLELSLQNQKSQIVESITDLQGKLTLLTGIAWQINPIPGAEELLIYQSPKNLDADQLTRLAFENRTDLKIAQKQVDASSINLKWQKSKAVPDVTLGALWDQRGGVFENEVGVNLGIPLPLWNQNKGNIRMAKAQLSEASVQQTLTGNKVRTEVYQSLRNWEDAEENYKFLSKNSLKDLETVQNGIFNNFRNGNLSLIEFTDFMESYHSTMMQYYQFSQNLVNSCEELNFTTNSKIF